MTLIHQAAVWEGGRGRRVAGAGDLHTNGRWQQQLAQFAYGERKLKTCAYSNCHGDKRAKFMAANTQVGQGQAREREGERERRGERGRRGVAKLLSPLKLSRKAKRLRQKAMRNFLAIPQAVYSFQRSQSPFLYPCPALAWPARPFQQRLPPTATRSPAAARVIKLY